MLFIVSGPSGAGKSTLCSRLLDATPGLETSVSYTTRAPRRGEAQGVHYHFVSPDDFRQMVSSGEFAEWAEVHGNLYGTARVAIATVTARGGSLIFDVDYQGAAALKTAYPDAVSVMVLPPSLEVLERRLRERGTDADEVIARRMGKARAEIAHAPSFDYVILNEDVDASFTALKQVFAASRYRAPVAWPKVARRFGEGV